MEWSEVNEAFACESKVATNLNDVVDAPSKHLGGTWAYATIVPQPLACFFLREKFNFGAKKSWCDVPVSPVSESLSPVYNF